MVEADVDTAAGSGDVARRSAGDGDIVHEAGFELKVVEQVVLASDCDAVMTRRFLAAVPGRSDVSDISRRVMLLPEINIPLSAL